MKNKLLHKLIKIANIQYHAPALTTHAAMHEHVNPQAIEKEVLELSKKLIAIHSISNMQEELNNALRVAAEGLTGYTIEPFKKNNIPSLLIHNSELGKRQFKILFNAHLDVVPGDIKQFVPHEKDGKLYGRGAYDMKSAAAAMLTLFKYYAKDVSFPFALQLTTDEEKGGFDGMQHQVEDGLRADFVITGECGSNLRIINQAKGMLRLKLIAYGKASHSAYPWLGENAILKLNSAIHEILKLYPLPKEEAYNTTINVTNITNRTEDIHTITPDYCEAIIDIRYMPKDQKTLLSKIKSVLPEGVEDEVLFNTAMVDTPANDPYVQLLKKVTEMTLQRETVLAGAHGASDLRHLAAVGVATVEFGPLGGAQHHENEWVDVQSLLDYYQILKKFILAIDGK